MEDRRINALRALIKRESKKAEDKKREVDELKVRIRNAVDSDYSIALQTVTAHASKISILEAEIRIHADIADRLGAIMGDHE